MSDAKSATLAYLDDHPDFRDSDESYMETARRLLDEDVVDGAPKTVARYVGQWVDGDGEDGDTPEKSTIFEDDYLHRENVHFNDADDVYVVWLDNRARAMPIDGSDYRAMREAYSNWDGQQATIEEICREFGISRPDFKALKSAAEWTHDAAPFTDEEMVDRTHDELVSDLVRQKEQAVYREWQQREWRKTQKQAEKWRHFQRDTLEPMLEGLEEVPKRTGRAFDPSPRSDEIAAVFFESDKHLDGRSLEGGFEEHRRLWMESLEQAIARTTAFARPEKIYCVLGSDQFNIDRHDSKTTAGTAQGQSLGKREAIFRVAEAGCEAVEMLRDVAPVVLRVLPGNHDRRSAAAYLWGLRQRYQDCDDVEVRGECEPYQYEQYGENLIGLHHGDGIGGGQTGKQSALTEKMVSDVPELVGATKHRQWLIGHEHRLWSDEGASLVEMAPTTKPPDEWEDYQGFPEGYRASAAWIFARQGGQVARVLSSV